VRFTTLESQVERLASAGSCLAREGGGRPVAVICGGSAGVGRATVREFADHGYDIAVFARGETGVDAAVADAETAGARSLGVTVDAADLAALSSAAEQVESALGEIDVWVNVSFVGALRYFWDTDPDVYRRITDVSYFGQVNGTRVALERMRPRDRGVIVQVGSALAYRGIPLQSAYCGAKHAVKGFTESIITELKHERSGVRIAMVQLPGLNTPQFDWNDNAFDEHPMPVPPIYEPELAAQAVRYVAEHRRRNMWVGVPTAYTILGNRIAPSFLDWYLARTGVKGQLTDENAPRRGSNVFVPKDAHRDAGAHGAFTDRAHKVDPWSWMSMRRPLVGALGVAGAAAVAAITWRRLS
jgi:NAD(P)-dependent dehydrogenase (short-subunit alcohol dehydrogenase family)